jgi:PKD repeat protein
MGFTPLEVQFTDETPGEFNAWSWDFGDGGTSDLQNPVHTYEVPGPFTVSLTANGPSGRAVATKVDYIHPYTQGVGGEAYPVNWTTILPSILLGMLGMTVIMLLLRHQKAEA